MSKLIIKDIYSEDIEINLQNITQLLGENIEKKNYVISSILKHFSSHRYYEEEEKQYRNVLLDGNDVGRNYFSVNCISTIEDIEKELSAGKNTMVADYLSNLTVDADLVRYFYLLNDDIQRIVNEFNAKIQVNSLKCKIKSIDIDLEKLFKNNLQIEISDEITSYLEYISNYSKINLYLELLCEINEIQPDKRLIIFNNIDNLITANEYSMIIKNSRNICQRNDFWFIFSSNRQNFACIDEELIGGINTLNDVIFNVSSLSIIKKYIENHYPYYKKFETEELIDYIKPIINSIGKRTEPLNMQSQIILQLLNSDMNIENKKITPVNKIELEYMINQ